MIAFGTTSRAPKERPLAEVVRPFEFIGDDRALVKAILDDRPGAGTALYDRYADYIHCFLERIMGYDPEIGDLIQEVFYQALANIQSIKKKGSLKPWLGSIAVHVARGTIRKRQRQRWLSFRAPESLPEQTIEELDDQDREVLRLTYTLLETLPVNERIAFSLRFIEGMELTETAQAMGVSLSTAKRKIAAAERRFLSLAKKNPLLQARIENASRWRIR